MGTLRTSIAEGICIPFDLLGFETGASAPSSAIGNREYDGAGAALDRVDDAVQVGDDSGAAGGPDEAAGRVHLGAHGAGGEVALGGVRLHLRHLDPADV